MRIRLRSTWILFILCLGIVGFLLIYQILNLPSDAPYRDIKSGEMDKLEITVKQLEKDIDAKHDIWREAESSVNALLKDFATQKAEVKHKQSLIPLPDKLKDLRKDITSVDLKPPFFEFDQMSVDDVDCVFSQSLSSQADIQMKDVYENVSFDNPDGGVWKQGWEIKVSPRKWSSTNILRVFLVPHSHNDPGWLKTFEEYFKQQTNNILDNMVEELWNDRNKTFIWAEISYFSLWWDQKTRDVHEKVKRLVDNGQLEIVSGGWVMPDEANSHYFSMLDQLFSGHEWLQVHLNIKPNNGWAIDPFGLSPTMAYLNKRSGLSNMVIQRGHYSIKKYLAARKNLEFRWRQLWDKGSSTDMLTHLMPFYSYDVPHTCGPDPKICCQFDFKRLNNLKVTCPWGVPPERITGRNIESKAEILLDQYRKKAELFKTNVLLVPLGDDFRYDMKREWIDQFSNYRKLFQKMNSMPNAYVQARFGTLEDYFRALREELSKLGNNKDMIFPSLSGDFFTYSDRDQHYWSGYYTTRPFYKRMDRIFHSYLRNAEILYSLMTEKLVSSFPASSVAEKAIFGSLERLRDSRHYHNLFQHHDGITGTGRSHVVVDYANKMLSGIQNSQFVIQQAAYVLLSTPESNFNEQNDYFISLESFPSSNSIPEVLTLELNNRGPSVIYIWNPEAQARAQLITVKINTPYIEVSDTERNPLLCQVDPVFNFEGEVIKDQYEVHFLADLSPLAFTRFTIQSVTPWSKESKYTTFGRILHGPYVNLKLPAIFSVSSKIDEEHMQFSIGHVSATFCSKGFLQKVESNGANVDVRLKFIKYNAGKGGAYLFLPVGKAKEYDTDSRFIVIQGSLRVSLNLFQSLIKHQVSLHNSPGVDGLGIRIINLFDIHNAESNTEYGMQFLSGVNSGGVFYTDLNGFQIIKRKYHSKLPLQANFYPMATQIFIEDEKQRLSILSAQPLGCSSLASGEMEVIFDRQLVHDDERGLGQGVLDSLLTQHSFHLLLEKRTASPHSHQMLNSEQSSDANSLAFASLSAHASLSLLIHPSVILSLFKVDENSLATEWKLGGDLPCDVHVVNVRSVINPIQKDPYAVLRQASVALTLHRVGFDCSFPSSGQSCSTNKGKIYLGNLFPQLFHKEIQEMTLSHMYLKEDLDKESPIVLQPMEIYSFKLRFSLPHQ